MRKAFIFSMMLSSLCLVFSPALAGEKSSLHKGYKLVWSDDFDKETLDTTSWNIEINNTGNGNGELEYYTDHPANVTVGKDPETGASCLILTARKEKYRGKDFTSGRITTANKRVFTHGKVESRIKLPLTANGLWPAFWLLGNNYFTIGWPRCGEIDILEMGHADGIKDGNQENLFNGACHWGFWKDGNYPNYAKATANEHPLQDGKFHLFTLEWDDKSIKMFLDQDKNPKMKPYYDMNIENKDGEWAAGHYFNHDFFILFNLAVGGHFTGITDSKDITALNNGEAKMYVDWVRVYQKDK